MAAKLRHDLLMTPAPQLTLPEQMASQAEFIINNLVQTDYQHVDNIDVGREIYDCDCNGFVAFVLQLVAPNHYGVIPKETKQDRPRAFEYYVFFSHLTAQSSNGWHRIEFLQNARRGDIIAWRFSSVEKGHDTGHVMVVAETPTSDQAAVFSVRVYDSAAKPHFEDTRGHAGHNETGVGTGFINFKVDSAGKPLSFQFAPPSSSPFEALPIAMGRLEPLQSA